MPFMPLVEIVGNVGTGVDPLQIGAIWVKVGVVGALIVIFSDPVQPVTVYVIVAAPENVALGVKTRAAVMVPAPAGVTADVPPAAPPLSV